MMVHYYKHLEHGYSTARRPQDKDPTLNNKIYLQKILLSHEIFQNDLIMNLS